MPHSSPARRPDRPRTAPSIRGRARAPARPHDRRRRSAPHLVPVSRTSRRTYYHAGCWEMGVEAKSHKHFVRAKAHILGDLGMQSQQLAGQRAQTILVVESDESTRRILDLSLRHAGFAVRVASNAEEGGKRLADRPDLVIVAADDPEGLDFCRRAKQGDALAPAVVLMLDAGVESKRRGLEAGADDFVAR